MRLKIHLLLAALGLGIVVNAQDHSRVKIDLSQTSLTELANLGLAVDHGLYKEGTFFISDFSSREIDVLKSNQIAYEIQIADVSAYYVARSKEWAITEKNAACPSGAGSGDFDPVTPSNFQLGSMAGFYTYQEMLDNLDAMRTAYPNLISVKQAIDTFLTIENRPIYWVRISDNPDTDEANEKEVMYSAVHHAREPNSMTATIFYMWYLLENYGSSPEIQHILNNTELYFVPCLNPDGYIYNETTNPNGGGMHRKNRRNIGTNNKGVDLNRNYSYGWGTTGVSTDPNNDTYPGTGAFSEIETQAMKWFVENHDFKFASNAHTYSDLVLFPIGTTTNEFAIHHDYFDRYTHYMVQYNGYVNEKSSTLYPASGDSDDYMYNDDLANKPRIFAITPEIGSAADGFWPAQNQIVPNSKNMVFTNLTMAHLPHRFAELKDVDPQRIPNITGVFQHRITRLGLDTGVITVNIVPLTNIQNVGSSMDYDLALMEEQTGSISYQLNPAIQLNDPIVYVLQTVYPTWTKEDTIRKVFGAISNQVFDNAESTPAPWAGQWTTNSHTFFSPGKAYSDSEGGGGPATYPNNSTRMFNFKDTVDLTDANNAELSFYAKWEIEADYDYCQLQVSTNFGNSWIGQCGKYTVLGTSANGSVQPDNEPVYEGTQNTWVQEEINLSDYVGQKIMIRFVLGADGGVRQDGFYFDDFRINHDGTVGLDEQKLMTSIYPNPTRDEVTISFAKIIDGATVQLIDLTGKKVANHAIQKGTTLASISTKNLKEGIYHLVLTTSDGTVENTKLVVVR